MTRLDVYLVKNSLAFSRTKAQEMIREGQVEVWMDHQFQPMTKPSFKVTKGGRIRVIGQSELLRYVSRSGLKLQYAMDELGVLCAGRKVLDIGLSTGGFAQCLLERGAIEVVGVDVGCKQLHPQLKDHPRLISFEGVNARYLRREWNHRGMDYQGAFNLITVDVSFISLKHILPEIPYFLVPKGEFLILVKPQFEGDMVRESLWSRYRLGVFTKKFYTKDNKNYTKVKEKVISICESLQLSVQNCVLSRLPGRNGNREFFIYGKAKN